MSLSFSAESAALPFITENRQMWEFFEPGLKKRLSELTVKDDFSSRVHSALLELLPAGQSSVDIVASRLAVSKRTLQRRLSDEQTNFQKVLNSVREELASYYLKSSTLNHTQISFLLGFSEPNSFYRAFHDWTGSTPETVRAQALT